MDRRALERMEAKLDALALQNEALGRELAVARVVVDDVEVRRARKLLRAHLLAFRPRRNPNMARFGKRKKRRA